jgi:hypothetical protein
MRSKEEIKSKPLKELAKWLCKNHLRTWCSGNGGEIRETNGK